MARRPFSAATLPILLLAVVLLAVGNAQAQPTAPPTGRSLSCTILFGNREIEFEGCRRLGLGVRVFWLFTNDDTILVAVQRRTESGYVAFGFSSEEAGLAMVPNSVVVGFRRPNGALFADDYRLMERASSGVIPGRGGQDLQALDVKHTNGTLTVLFERPLVPPSDSLPTVQSGQPIGVLWSVGEAPESGQRLSRHTDRSSRTIRLRPRATPSPTPELSPTPSPAASASASASATPESSVTPSASATPESSATPSASATPDFSETPSASATPDFSETPSASTAPDSSVSPTISASSTPEDPLRPPPDVPSTESVTPSPADTSASPTSGIPQSPGTTSEPSPSETDQNRDPDESSEPSPTPESTNAPRQPVTPVTPVASASPSELPETSSSPSQPTSSSGVPQEVDTTAPSSSGEATETADDPNNSPSESLSPSASEETTNPDDDQGSNTIVPLPTRSQTTVPREPDESSDDDSVCFPADGTVELSTGESRSMKDLQVGDLIRIGHGSTSEAFGEVFFFSHRNPTVVTTFVEISGADSNHIVRLSPSHFVAISGGSLVAARHVRVGMKIVLSSGQVTEVSSVGTRRMEGLYAPHTVSGTGEMFVDGVRVSEYTQAVSPRLAKALLSGLRVLYRLGLLKGRLGSTFFEKGHVTARVLGLGTRKEVIVGH